MGFHRFPYMFPLNVAPRRFWRFGAQIGVYIAALVYYCGEILQAPVIPLGQVGQGWLFQFWARRWSIHVPANAEWLEGILDVLFTQCVKPDPFSIKLPRFFTKPILLIVCWCWLDMVMINKCMIFCLLHFIIKCHWRHWKPLKPPLPPLLKQGGVCCFSGLQEEHWAPG